MASAATGRNCEILDSFGFERVSVLKIDVEGYENEVLKGASDTIRRNRPVILIEIVGDAPYDSASPEAIVRILGIWRLIEAFDYTVAVLRGADYIALPK